MTSKKTIILASQSRDRKKLLSNACIPHEVIVSEYVESPHEELSSKELSLFHAHGKALSVQKLVADNPNMIQTTEYIIIAADSVVDLNGKILGKATDKEHAIRMLNDLMGKTHLLITGVVIFDSDEDTTSEYVGTTEVKFSSLTEDEVESYVTYSNEYRWRAGSYSMFDRASVFIESISGSPSNVIGLPMEFVYQELKKLGVNLLHFRDEK
jgi:septum formation protein